MAATSGGGQLFDTTGDVPGIDTDDCPDEFILYVHGFRNDEQSAIENFNDFQDSLEANGYDGTVAGFSWDSNTWQWQFGEAERRADENGCPLAAFLAVFACRCPNTELRLAAHSLGSRVILRALECLCDEIPKTWGACDGSIKSVDLFGAAVGRDAPIRYREAINTKVGAFRNYHSRQDSALGWFEWSEEKEALGRHGANGDPPDGYEDHDVTDEIGEEHSDYNEDGDDDGVVDDATENWNGAESEDGEQVDSVGDAGLSERSLDRFVTTYNQHQEQYGTLLSRVVGDGPFTLHLVTPAPRRPDRPISAVERSLALPNREPIEAYSFRLRGTRVTDYTEGSTDDASVHVYATPRAIRYVTRSETPVAAFEQEREDGNTDARGTTPANRAVLGTSTYATDTQRTVVATWRAVTGGVRFGIRRLTGL